MPKKISKSVYMISIDNIHYSCYHSKLYGKNSKPAFVIKECLVEDSKLEGNDDAIFIQGEGWTSKSEDFGYIHANGNMLVESFNHDDLSKIVEKFEEHLLYLLDLVSNSTDWELRPFYNRKVLTEFGLTRKDLIKILYNLSTIKSINDLKEVSNGIWVKYLL